jgi:hypothetical protein
MNFNPMQFMNQLNQLKSRGGDPNQMIQQMLNSGRVSQSQYDNAVKMAQQIQQMLTPGGRR